ncbi:SusC/RagA family TonB-linked outer membrane protein [Marixanthomonas spongiae]|uniref:SusC/RagA family TonB-linked outer membrane protein n=1 Tax=Marixanthomonas spongiae TaxID=2174845 RepID=A0A2U0HX01_9FLAO|nr:SusC/RagA family TonB-linked outer membrane protein [Marixanthomonas spongiae]PVW13349.1 SusC/RagA family TonB-linked outer membrane protein [Marixanthomonas spongiae]
MKTKFSGILTLLLALVVQLSFAQEKTITGTITDDTGLPLPGVNIIIKGTSKGTQSDFDGNYSIQAEVGQTLTYSYVGFETQQKKVGASNTIDVTMQAGSELDEVVITAFGIKRTRNEITGNVVTVNSEAIEKSPFVSADQALQGTVSGLQINATSGTPGSSQEIRIRGIQSVTASNEPLIVIDGIPVTAGNISGSANVSSVSVFSLVAPSNIENITVLKDAVSTAPYGASGSNGVILITTKSGKSGKTQFNLTTNTGYVNNAVKGLTPLSGSQKLELLEESLWQSFGSGINGDGTIATRGDVRQYILDSPSRFAGAINWLETGRPDIDWEDAVENDNAALTDINFSVTQGGENSTFYASLGYNYSEATVIGSDYERVSGSLKYNTDLNDKLNLGITINGSNIKQNASLEQGAFFSNPNLSKLFLSPFINPYNADGTPNIGEDFTDFTSLHNTVYTARNDIRRNDVTRVIQATDLSYDLLRNLTLKTVFNIDYSLAYYKGYQNPVHGDGEDIGGSAIESAQRLFNYTSQNQVDYSFDLGEKHSFRVTGLTEYAKYKTYYLQGYGENFPNKILKNLSATSDNYGAFSSFSDRTSTRLVGLFNYDFDSKYVLDASISYQGDSRFSKDTRFDDFYSIGVAWNIHEESFLKNSSVINTLRLKGGYGTTGNSGINRNQFQALANFSNTYNDGSPALFIAGFGTTAGWEKGLKRDLALDFGLFNNRISGTLGYYSNETSDMLLNAPLAYSSQFIGDGGGGRALQNIGNMSNKGYEFEISADVISNDNFKWNVRGNFASLENEVFGVPEDAEIITGTRVVQDGKKVYEWYLPVWAGVDPANGDPLWYTDETLTETTNTYSDAERVYTDYNALPTYSGGFGTRVDLHNFFAEASFYFAGGNKVFEDWAGYTQTSNGTRLNSFNATTVLYDGIWRQPGDNATHPRMDFNDPLISNAASSSTRFLYDGDYIRLRSVAVGYSFNPELTDSIGIDGLTVSVRGTNLVTWIKDDRLKWDPEIDTSGFTNLSTPPTKAIALNVNLKF